VGLPELHHELAYIVLQHLPFDSKGPYWSCALRYDHIEASQAAQSTRPYPRPDNISTPVTPCYKSQRRWKQNVAVGSLLQAPEAAINYPACIWAYSACPTPCQFLVSAFHLCLGSFDLHSLYMDLGILNGRDFYGKVMLCQKLPSAFASSRETKQPVHQ
jgi:hypothetical protein